MRWRGEKVPIKKGSASPAAGASPPVSTRRVGNDWKRTVDKLTSGPGFHSPHETKDGKGGLRQFKRKKKDDK